MEFQEQSPVGRSAPMDAILRAAGEATAGGVRTVVISGEPGIGKTFLVEAVGERLRAGGWLVAWGTCPEAEGVPALWPWQQVLVSLVSQVRPPLELANRLDSLIGDESDNGTEPVADPADARFRQHEAVARYLALATRAKPLVIVLDDLQWADADSSRLLLDLLTLRRGGRLLIIATVRSSGGDPGLEEVLGRLEREGAVRLSLEGLAPESITQLAEAQASALSLAQASRLHEQTAGNPFFLRECLALAGGEPFQTVQDLLRQRLALLSDSTRELLTTAAVIGRQVDRDLLGQASDYEEGLLLDALAAAIDSGLLVEYGPGQLRFGHDLIRETLSADLLPMQRRRLHSRVSRLFEDASGQAAAIAFHALAAGPSEDERAAHFAELAGMAAAKRLAFDDAARWLTAAIDLVKSMDQPSAKLVSLQLALLRAQLDGGDWIAARRTWAEAILTAETADDPQLSIRTLVAFDAPALWTLDGYPDLNVAGRAEQALASLPSGDSDLPCRLLGTLAAELNDGSDDPRCDSLSTEAVAMARRLNDPRLLAVSLTARFHAIAQPRFAAEEIAVAEELIELGRDHSMPAVELLGHGSSATYRLMTFDVRRADAAAAASEPLLRRLSLPQTSTIHNTWSAARLMADGRLDEAFLAFEATFAEQRALGVFDTEVRAALVFGTLAALREDWDAVGRQLELLEVSDSPHARSLRVWHLAKTGDVAAARALIEAGEALLRHDWAELGALGTASEAALAAGSETSARGCYQHLLPYSGWLATAGNVFVMGPIDYYLGRLARALGDVSAGATYLQRAEEDCHREGLLWWAQRMEAERVSSVNRSEVLR